MQSPLPRFVCVGTVYWQLLMNKPAIELSNMQSAPCTG